MITPSINDLLTWASQFRNPAIAEQLTRMQGASPPKEKVNYYGSLKGFAFFSRNGRFLGVPDETAVTAMAQADDLIGGEELWKRLAGLE